MDEDVMCLLSRDSQISSGFKCHQLKEFNGSLRGFIKLAENDKQKTIQRLPCVRDDTGNCQLSVSLAAIRGLFRKFANITVAHLLFLLVLVFKNIDCFSELLVLAESELWRWSIRRVRRLSGCTFQ